MFVDDTFLIFKIDRNKVNYDKMNCALSHILRWFDVNNLMLYTNKTKFALRNILKTKF